MLHRVKRRADFFPGITDSSGTFINLFLTLLYLISTSSSCSSNCSGIEQQENQ
jgi:hypothetical protein